MPKMAKLGTKVFAEECEDIQAANSQVTGVDCAALGARLSAGEFKQLKGLDLVSFCCSVYISFCFIFLIVALL